jgi:steroid delta-isomerase-like uncharacterized protein
MSDGVDALIDAFEAAWSGREVGAFGAVCSADLHYEDPLCDEPLEGPAALGEHAERLWALFPDARVERTGPRMHADGHVAAPCKVLGTHRGDLEGLPATERFVVVQAVVVARLEPATGLLWRVRAFYDAYAAAVQLGVLPGRGSLGEKALLMVRGFGLRSRSS